MMKAEAERAREADVIRAKEEYHEKVRYQQELERQLEEQELNKQKAYEEFLKEKLMIDEIVRKIYEEDMRYDSLQVSLCRIFWVYIEVLVNRKTWSHVVPLIHFLEAFTQNLLPQMPDKV